MKENKNYNHFLTCDKTLGKTGALIFLSEKNEELKFLTEDCSCIEEKYLHFIFTKIIACSRQRQITIKKACQIPKGNNRLKNVSPKTSHLANTHAVGKMNTIKFHNERKMIWHRDPENTANNYIFIYTLF